MNDISETRLARACQQLVNSLAQPGKARCMACDTLKKPDRRWAVLGYAPNNPRHPPMAYLVCGDCMKSASKLQKAQIGIETKSRALAEGTRP